jgi:hypothetical protein
MKNRILTVLCASALSCVHAQDDARTAALAVIEHDAEALAAMVSEDPQLTITRQVAHCRAALRRARAAAA